MAPISSGFGFDPELVQLDTEASVLCNLRFDLEQEDRDEWSRSGTWWNVLVGRTHSHDLIGIRATPGKPLIGSPVVLIHGPEVETLASTPAVLLPVRLFLRACESEQMWSRIVAMEDSTRSELTALHSSLGGNDGLSALRDVLADARIRLACTRTGVTREQSIRTVLSVLSRLDGNADAERFYDAVGAVALRGEVPSPVAQGAWSAAAATLLLRYVRRADHASVDSRLLGRAAWMRMTGPAALDSTRDHARPTGIGDMQEILQQAAATLGSDDAIDPTWRADPLWSAVAAVRDAGDRYGGDAHLDAARQLLAAGEPVRAFDALTTAASFSAVCKRVSDVTALHEAREIASRQDWSEIEESLLRVPDPSPEE